MLERTARLMYIGPVVDDLYTPQSMVRAKVLPTPGDYGLLPHISIVALNIGSKSVA